MKKLQIREAKANFSALIADAQRGRPTLITRHSRPSAMIVPVEAGQRLYPLQAPSLADWLLAMPGPLQTQRDDSTLRDADL